MSVVKVQQERAGGAGKLTDNNDDDDDDDDDDDNAAFTALVSTLGGRSLRLLIHQTRPGGRHRDISTAHMSEKHHMQA